MPGQDLGTRYRQAGAPAVRVAPVTALDAVVVKNEPGHLDKGGHLRALGHGSHPRNLRWRVPAGAQLKSCVADTRREAM
ncbi:hypothetical protein GCM10011608_32980 [Micromonospora sonchi]|uniref:Uncharacterized protein n=1 Tax=Micromonospora sonchi TaxID=1763543 RepID=A0A917TYS1_9ACTN|nr:hypothetical protein GCM10011608_32980 [Micromonospora sonchi]